MYYTIPLRPHVNIENWTEIANFLLTDEKRTGLFDKSVNELQTELENAAVIEGVKNFFFGIIKIFTGYRIRFHEHIEFFYRNWDKSELTTLILPQSE